MRKTLSRSSLALILGLGVLAGLSGCYERVVGAHGLGSDRYSVEERYQTRGGWLENKIMGPQEPEVARDRY